MRTLLAGLVALVSLVVAAPADAQPSAPGPHTTYLNGLDLHTRSGRVVHLPLHGNRYVANASLLGRSPQGWVLLGGDLHYYVASAHHASKLPSADNVDIYVDELLSADGGLIWESVPDQAGDLSVRALDLSGHGAGQWYLDYQDGQVLAADGDHAWVGGDSLVELTRRLGDTKPTQTVVDPRKTDLVDARHDLVFFRDKLGTGPTRLSAPGEVTWRVKGFLPLSVSRHGTYVAGIDSRNVLQVRRVDDGSLVSTLGSDYDYQDAAELSWAGDAQVLYTVIGHGRNALEGCDVVTGSCERVTPWSDRPYSLPDSVHELV